MRFSLLAAMLVALLFCSNTAWAALPYYNADLGYTIWLPQGWAEVSGSDLSRFANFRDGVGSDVIDWKAGYTIAGNANAELLVAELHGRVVSKESISNFNRFVVRELKRVSIRGGRKKCAMLRKANFDKVKNVLRLELDVADCRGKSMTSVVYVIYTSTGMLKFTGLVAPGDKVSVQALDDAVSTLYLDYGLRQ